ncbi:MAG: hypothetical protein HC904_06465 [Blastochloris sp.]|nr:hypothetical protein [Blastochloris sp.]
MSTSGKPRPRQPRSFLPLASLALLLLCPLASDAATISLAGTNVDDIGPNWFTADPMNPQKPGLGWG